MLTTIEEVKGRRSKFLLNHCCVFVFLNIIFHLICTYADPIPIQLDRVHHILLVFNSVKSMINSTKRRKKNVVVFKKKMATTENIEIFK